MRTKNISGGEDVGGKSRKRIWITAAVCIVCLGVIAGALALCLSGAHKGQLAAAVYPSRPPYPDERSGNFQAAYKSWNESNNVRRAAAAAAGTPDGFYGRTIREFLYGADGENRVYSPVNVYMALSLLAEITGGESRGQILGLLGAESIEELREQANNIWTANYRNDGASASILANSLWLNESRRFNGSALNALAEKYYVSSFSGDPASEEMTKQLRRWLNDQTGGLLSGYADNMSLDPEMMVTLCSTVYFSAKWDDRFSRDNNDVKIFHGARGDPETEFMNRTLTYGPYYRGEDFGAVKLSFTGGGCMWLILPDEDKTTDGVIDSGDYYLMINNASERSEYTPVKVNLSMPKFDVSSDIGLREGLQRLGVTNVFDGYSADFSPLLADGGEAFISGTKHAARVKADEDGVVAAAFTAISVAGAALPPDDEIDFVLDRPFLFVIMSDTGHPLFAGTVNQL